MRAIRTAARAMTLGIGILYITVSAEATTIGGCVDDISEQFFRNRVPTNCTANDVTFLLAESLLYRDDRYMVIELPLPRGGKRAL